jgi:DNA-binding NarL/FixJ family response regulator
MTERIRVLLADDQAITRTGLQHLLSEEEDIEVVGAARTGAEAVELAASLQPDVILMDLRNLQHPAQGARHRPSQADADGVGRRRGSAQREGVSCTATVAAAQ